MSESTERDQLRFNHWGVAGAGLAFLAMVVVFFGWLDTTRAEAELGRLHERLCGNLPADLQPQFDRMTSGQEPDAAAFAALHAVVKSWSGSIGGEDYNLRLFREEGPVWREVTWNEEWRTVYEKPYDGLLGQEDCETRLHDGRIAGARRYRGAAASNIVVVATRQRD